jgi:hypothetical protein
VATILGGKGVAILFFTLIIALFAYFIYFLVAGNTDPAYYWQRQTQRGATSASRSPTSVKSGAALDKGFILIRNKAETVGKLRITYLGTADKHLLFDVHLLDLDPNFAYRYTIPLDQAKERFRIGDRFFKAHAISNGKIRLTQISF